MCKRQLLQAIERMPNEAEVEVVVSDPGDDMLTINLPITKAEFVDGKIRIS